MIRIGVIQFPGSNCERETILAVQRASMEAVPFLWNQDPDLLKALDGYIIVGGFSYEDRGRAGIIAALLPVMQEIKIQSENGKPILGICNGAQVLVETGLVPGCENNKLAMALTDNKRMANGKILGTGFYNAWIYLRLSDDYQRNAFTRHLSLSDKLHIPVAHAEGRFVMSEALQQEIMTHGLGVFQYCDEEGDVINNFPVNPNSSTLNLAAISNKAGNVMAMMPHPERTPNGDAIFTSMREYIEMGRSEKVAPLHYYPRKQALPRYQQNDQHECIVELTITDNQAITVQQTLRQLGFPVSVKRYTHWNLKVESDATFIAITASGVLFNPRKESEVTLSSDNENSFSLLVRAHDDWQGRKKHQILADHFNVTGIRQLQQSVLWTVTADQGHIAEMKAAILSTHIFYNPYAHDCYDYQPKTS